MRRPVVRAVPALVPQLARRSCRVRARAVTAAFTVANADPDAQLRGLLEGRLPVRPHDRLRASARDIQIVRAIRSPAYSHIGRWRHTALPAPAHRLALCSRSLRGAQSAEGQQPQTYRHQRPSRSRYFSRFLCVLLAHFFFSKCFFFMEIFEKIKSVCCMQSTGFVRVPLSAACGGNERLLRRGRAAAAGRIPLACREAARPTGSPAGRSRPVRRRAHSAHRYCSHLR